MCCRRTRAVAVHGREHGHTQIIRSLDCRAMRVVWWSVLQPQMGLQQPPSQRWWVYNNHPACSRRQATASAWLVCSHSGVNTHKDPWFPAAVPWSCCLSTCPHVLLCTARIAAAALQRWQQCASTCQGLLWAVDCPLGAFAWCACTAETHTLGKEVCLLALLVQLPGY